jgi:hypothetical protein
MLFISFDRPSFQDPPLDFFPNRYSIAIFSAKVKGTVQRFTNTNIKKVALFALVENR